MSGDVLSDLGVEREGLFGQLTAISERHGASANFIVSSLLASSLRDPSTGVLFLALYHPFAHYAKALGKLGPGPGGPLAQGRLVVLDLLQEWLATLDGSNLFPTANSVRSLFLRVKESAESLRGRWGRAAVLVDDLSGMLISGANLRDLFVLIHSLKYLAASDPRLALLINSHSAEGDGDLSRLDAFLRDRSEVSLEVAPLRSGPSPDVTGAITLRRRDAAALTQLSPSTLFHYKATDRSVKVFPPGNIL